MTEKDFNYCQAITDVELYTQQALFSREALAIQTHEFAAIMADFADLTHERRGLDFNVLPMAKYFRDKYYTDYTQKMLPDMKINSFPEILHFSGHQENVSSILRLLGYQPAYFTKLDPGAMLTFDFFRFQNVQKKSETHV